MKHIKKFDKFEINEGILDIFKKNVTLSKLLSLEILKDKDILDINRGYYYTHPSQNIVYTLINIYNNLDTLLQNIDKIEYKKRIELDIEEIKKKYPTLDAYKKYIIDYIDSIPDYEDINNNRSHEKQKSCIENFTPYENIPFECVPKTEWRHISFSTIVISQIKNLKDHGYNYDYRYLSNIYSKGQILPPSQL